MIPWFFAAFVLLLVALLWLVRRRAEAFVDSAPAADPKEILQRVRGMLARYNDPALWEHLESVAGRDIGQLARATAEAETAVKQ
jgi:hypothetical protein